MFDSVIFTNMRYKNPLNRTQKMIVFEMYVEKIPLSVISKTLDITVKYLKKIIKTHKLIEIMGNKDEPYCTEQEMLTPPVYKAEELEDDELEIFNNLK